MGGHYHLIEVASIARKCSLYARSARRRKLVYTEAAATDSSRHVASEPLAGTWQGLFNSLDAALASGEVGAAPPDMPVHGAWCTCGGASRCPPSASRSRVAACPVSPPPASPAQWMLTLILLPIDPFLVDPNSDNMQICRYVQTGFSGGRRNSSTESRRPGGCETGCIAESLHVV